MTKMRGPAAKAAKDKPLKALASETQDEPPAPEPAGANTIKVKVRP